MSLRLALVLIIAFCAASPAGAESFQSWAARGAREEREKDPKSAFSSYSNALSLWRDGDGSAPKARVLRARAGLREKSGDDAGALKDLSDSLALDKKSANGFHRRGLLLLKAGKTSAAIGDFYRAVALDIGFAQAYADRASAYALQGEKGFAREDYLHACDLGIKTACAKAAALASKPLAKNMNRVKPEAPAPASPQKTEPPPAPKSPMPVAAGKPAAPAYQPKFKDCLAALDACVENGEAFGSCVKAAPNCVKKAVKGCCPAACLRSYQKALDRDRSEAAAYREYFTRGAACGALLDKR